MAGSAPCMDVSAEPQPSDGSGIKDRTSSGKEGPGCIYRVMLVALALTVLIVLEYLRHVVDPQFSVQVTAIEGLDPLRTPTISPAFNLTIRADNRRNIRRFCQENSTVALSYNHLVIGWGDVPAFCVDKWLAVDLNVSSSHEGVFLSQQLRGNMASDMHVGKLELSIEMKPINPDNASWACFVSCAFKLGELETPCKRLCVS